MNKKFVSYILMALFMGAISYNANAADTKNKPVGKWKFSVVDAPYGYEKGEFEIIKEKKQYTGTMMFDGFEYLMELESVSFEKEQLSFSLYVEGEDVLIILKFSEKDILNGKVSYSQGELRMSAERVKK